MDMKNLYIFYKTLHFLKKTKSPNSETNVLKIYVNGSKEKLCIFNKKSIQIPKVQYGQVIPYYALEKFISGFSNPLPKKKQTNTLKNM